MEGSIEIGNGFKQSECEECDSCKSFLIILVSLSKFISIYLAVALCSKHNGLLYAFLLKNKI